MCFHENIEEKQLRTMHFWISETWNMKRKRDRDLRFRRKISTNIRFFFCLESLFVTLTLKIIWYVVTFNEKVWQSPQIDNGEQYEYVWRSYRYRGSQQKRLHYDHCERMIFKWNSVSVNDWLRKMLTNSRALARCRGTHFIRDQIYIFRRTLNLMMKQTDRW